MVDSYLQMGTNILDAFRTIFTKVEVIYILKREV